MDKRFLIQRMYPEAIFPFDFSVVVNETNGIEEIVNWNINAKQPTEEELQAEHQKYLEEQLQNMKDSVIAHMREDISKVIYEGFISETTGHLYSYEEHDQQNMSSKLMALYIGSINQVVYRTADAGDVIHDRETFIAVFNEAEAHKERKLTLYRKYKGRIEELKDQPETLNFIYAAFKDALVAQ